MELDLGTTIIGTMVSILGAMPFILIGRSRRKKARSFRQTLTERAEKNHCRIEEYEALGSYAIGIDTSKSIVFFYKKTKDREVHLSLDLRDIQSCQVINTGRTLKAKNGTDKVIDRLELGFEPSVKNRPELKMEFFNTDENIQLNGELQSIEKWSKRINTLIRQEQQQ